MSFLPFLPAFLWRCISLGVSGGGVDTIPSFLDYVHLRLPHSRRSGSTLPSLAYPLYHPKPVKICADSQLSLGDARSYYLSTAANELGVIWAKSEVGNVMVPVSYQDMEDSKTGKVERRKVAKPEDV